MSLGAVVLRVPMADLSVVFQNVYFAYGKATQALFPDLSLHFTKGWTGIVGANGVGKSTILKLATGELEPSSGDVAIPEFPIYCPQRTDTVPDHLQALVHAMNGDAFEIKGRLCIEDGWIDQARVTGKDGTAGKPLKQLSGRLSRAYVKLQKRKVKKHYVMGIWMPGEKSTRDTLFNLPAGALCLGGVRWLHYPDLPMKPDDRVALTGPNGSGKSTLIGHIMLLLNIDKNRVIYLPQEIDIQASQDIMAKARTLPNEKLGQMMTVVSRLGLRPRRLLDSVEPSPGEIRKILLAIGITETPNLIVMDEPTNHLDLPSIECLKQALADCPCGLLLVSHDQRFLDALARERWHISEESKIKENIQYRTRNIAY
jgi:ATPase subunit of ABC transporter with duplicated ATPase domains